MKRMTSIILMMCMVVATSFSVVAEEAVQTYYVSDVSGSDSNAGSQSAPVKTLTKALELAEANSTIYVMDDVLVGDESNNDAPWVIDKSVTIKGDSQTLPTISLRAGGVVLGADVSFENVKIGTTSMLRPGIAANGHTLQLTNVYQDASLQPLQIYGGTFIDATDSSDYGTAVRGTKSDIQINGGSYEAVYAGSINGDIEMPVSITVAKGNGLTINGIYAGSTTKDPKNAATAGQAPVLDSSISVTGQVDVFVQDSAYVKNVNGVSESHKVNLTTEGTGRYSFTITKIDNLTVNGGTFAPASESDFGTATDNEPNVTLVGSENNKATLDLSDCSYSDSTVSVANFTGSANGIFVLPKNTILNVSGVLTGGPTEFRVGGGMPWSSAEIPGYSGWMEYETTYVKGNCVAGSDGTFVISNPYPTQEDIAFTEDSSTANGWKTTSGTGFEPPELIDFTPVDKTVSYEDANTVVAGYGNINLEVITAFSDESMEQYADDLSFVPLDYQIIYTDLSGNITEYTQQASVIDENGYYLCNYTAATAINDSEEILMKLEPAGDTINICKGETDLAAGTYEIAITALTTSGSVTKSCALTILPSEGGTITHTHQWQTAWDYDDSHHWHECSASDCTLEENSEKEGYEAHHGGVATCNSKAICKDCGQAYGKENSNNHTGGTEVRNRVEATETENGYTGDIYCLGCNAKLETGYVILATGNGQTSDNDDAGDESENEIVESLEIGANIFDSASQIMYVVTNADSTSGTVECKQLRDNAVKKVTVPDTVKANGVTYKVTSIAAKAFKGKKITSITIGKNVKTIGKEAFSGCTKLEKVTIGKNVTVIGTSAFAGCKKLKTVQMGNKVTTIGNKAFYNCTKLTGITIPSKVNKIGKQAFYKCKKLKKITIKTTKLTSKKVGSKAFTGTPKNATVKVPKKSLKAYKKFLYQKGISKKATIKK